MTAPTTTSYKRCTCGHAEYEHADSPIPAIGTACALCGCKRFKVDRRPAWMERMQAGQLKAKDLTGSVAL